MKNSVLAIFIMLSLIGSRSTICAQSKEIVIEGVLKMHLLDNQGNIKTVSQYRKTDYMNNYLAFVIETNRAIDVRPYLDEEEEEWLNKTRHTKFMIGQGFQHGAEFAKKYANKRVRVKGKIYVPGGGWRNATEVVMGLKDIQLVDAIKSQRREKVAPRTSKSVSSKVPQGYVNLGLPSGTLWKSRNERGTYHTYREAKKRFGKGLPTKKQCEELVKCCQWRWVGNGCKVIGPNGNSITLQAWGYREYDGNVYYVGTYGSYWSSTLLNPTTPWSLRFYDTGEVEMGYGGDYAGYAVRLVK